MVVRDLFFKERRSNDYPYYRQVWTRVVLALLTVSFVPLIVIGGGVLSYTFDKLETHTLDALRVQVRAHQRAIDDFLSERQSQLKLIAALYPMTELVAPGRLDQVFTTLQQQTPGFVDLGIIDLQGRHRAYVGPYALLNNDYHQEGWFLELMEQDAYISDVYLGFRQTPHFIIAVRQVHADGAYILRATVDSEYFDTLVAGGTGELKAETFIINRQGALQTRSEVLGGLLAPSGITPDVNQKGVRLVDQGSVLLLTLWQEKVPWLNVVQVKRSEIYGGLNRVRLAVILTFLVGAVLIAGTVLLTTGNLVGMLEAKGQSLRILDTQLRRTSYMSSSMELSMGFFEEVRDILSNIDVAVQWLINHRTSKDFAEEKETLFQIAREASRGHVLVDKFVRFVRPEEPIVTKVRVNELLDDLVAFLGKDFQRLNIRVVRDYQTPSPGLRSDRGKLRQVFQNLLLNAMAALGKGGRLDLVTRSEKNRVVVVVRDTGPGISEAERAKIFEPLYSTKPQGTGLGLPICKAIMDQLGGSLTLDSQPGQGASFTVVLPNHLGDLGGSRTGQQPVNQSPNHD